MADLERESVRLSRAEIDVMILALAAGRMSLAAGETLALAQQRDLDRAISKVLDAEKRLARGVQSPEGRERAGDADNYGS
jgi:hypothetical protein